MPRVRRVPEADIELIRNGEAKSADVARKWGVSRQAISGRVYYRSKRQRQSDRTDLKRWKLLFLYRIGLSSQDISEILGYHRHTAKSLLKTEWGMSIRETFHYPPKAKNSPQLRRWSAYFLMRLGFEDDEVAELTGYASGSVRYVYRNWFRQMVRKKKSPSQRRALGKSKQLLMGTGMITPFIFDVKGKNRDVTVRRKTA